MKSKNNKIAAKHLTAGRRQTTRSKSRNFAPRNAEGFSARPEQFQEDWIRVTQVITRMRTDRVSVTKASKEFGISPKKVVRLGASALRKARNGRYTAKPNDSLLRILVVPSSDGLIEIGVNGSRVATLVAKYWVAVQKYLETGNVIPLRAFEGVVIPIAGDGQFSLITDPAQLRVLGSAGVLSFETLYAKTA
jgi:hypothetical protein